MKRNTYDALAPYYDFLSLLLGKSYQYSKLLYFDQLKEGDQVLYLGGGTGANLPEILGRIGPGGSVHYIEASGQMIEKARKRTMPMPEQRSSIVFLHQSEFSKIPEHAYDVVLTQFFLDILPEDEIEKLFQELDKRVSPNTRWIFVDFFPVVGSKWLIKIMIWFFRLSTRNPRKDLPDYARYFRNNGWELKEQKWLQKGFIQAWVLKREKSD
jgi:ubiquinone/menaquinone biosynthesis C-methylase UbiE